MSSRVIPRAVAALALLVVAVVPWLLPHDLAPRAEAQNEAEPAAPHVKQVAAEAALFVSLRMGDFTGDELMKTIFADLGKELSLRYGLPVTEVERATVAVVRGGTVRVIQTRKAYDKEKLIKELVKSPFGVVPALPVPKDAKELPPKDAEPKVEIKEKKVAGKTIHYAGEWSRWAPGFCALDKTSYAFGDAAALETLVAGKGKASAQITSALALTDKHSMVLAIDGKRLKATLDEERKQMRRENEELRKQFDQESKKDGEVKDKKEKVEEDKDKGKKDKAKDDEDDFDPSEGFENLFEYVLLPYKPLYTAKLALVTGDVKKKSYTLKAAVTVEKEDELDDAEVALKSLLYAMRELAVLLPRQEEEFRGLKPLSAGVALAFKEAKVQRKGNTVSTTVTMTPDDGLAKKVRASIAEAKKKREERLKKLAPPPVEDKGPKKDD